jgi:hypothetical protein
MMGRVENERIKSKYRLWKSKVILILDVVGEIFLVFNFVAQKSLVRGRPAYIHSPN